MLPTKLRSIWPSIFRIDDFLEINQSETRIAYLYREPSIDSTYQVTVHLAKQFQRRRFLEINQSQTRIACGGHVCERIGTK
jgi:hypothetical protein